MVKASFTNAEGGSGSIPDGAAEIPYASWSKQKQKTKHRDRSNIVTHSIMTLKMVHKKKILKTTIMLLHYILGQPTQDSSRAHAGRPRSKCQFLSSERVF